MELSIVTTLYLSAGHLPEFHARVSAAVRSFAADDYEMILVNDGSPDNSLAVAMEIQQHDSRVVVVDLSRNFGHHKAIMTGLMHARGRLVWLIDCDLEEPPELLEQFGAEMRRTGADAVYGQQGRRKGDWFERCSGNLFYRLLNMLSPEPMPSNALTVRLMTRRYVDSLTQHQDREAFLLGLWTITGYRQVPLSVVKGSKGESSYTLRRRFSVLVNAVTSFSNRPLIFIFYFGLFIFSFSLVGAACLVIRWLCFRELLIGWPSLIVSIWLLGGGTIMCIGIIGVYLAKIFIEVKQRPYTVVRAVHYSNLSPTQIAPSTQKASRS